VVAVALAFLAFHGGGNLPAILGLYVVVALSAAFHARLVSAAILLPIFFLALEAAGEAAGLAVGVQGLTSLELTLVHVGGLVLLQYLVATVVGDHLLEHEALVESEQRTRELMEAVGDAIFVIDDQGRVADANHVAWRSLGLTQAQLIGMRVADFEPRVGGGHPHELIQEASEGFLAPFETEHRRADGSVFPVEVKVSPFHKDGRACVVVVARDLTQRKAEQQAVIENEQRLRAIFEHEPECVKLVGRDHELIDMNPAGLSMIAADGIDQVRGLDVRELMAPGYVELFEEGVAAVFRGEKTFQLFEVIDLDGSRHWMEQHAAPLWDPDDPTRVKEMLAVTRDITERKRSEQLGLHRQRLEALGTLASGIAHDLNNLLAPILLSIGELDSVRGLDPALVKTLEGSTRRAADMVSQLLGFSRGLEGEHRRIDPLDIVDELERIVRATFPKSIELVFEVPGEDESCCSIAGDPTQLHQVLLNLCVNSRDAMGGGGGRLVVGASCRTHAGGDVPGPLEAEAGDYLVFTVRDSGVGIPAGELERIFEPFYTTKGPDRGTGLGLSSALGIIGDHGGFVTIDSKEGEGTCFEVYLPAISSRRESKRLVRYQEPLEGIGRTVLVVDDEVAVLAVAERVIQRLGFEVQAVTSGEEGLAMLEELGDAVELVLSDLRMPGMGGAEFLTETRRRWPGLPLVLATGHLDPAHAERLAALEGLVRLEKPYSITELQAALHQALS